MHGSLVLQLLILLVVANGTAVVAKKAPRDAFGRPLDGGATLCRWATHIRTFEDNPRRRGIRVGDFHLRGADGSRMAGRKL